MAKTTFSGPIRTGKDTGAPTTRTIGTVSLVQACTVVAGAMKNILVFPPNSSMIGSTVIVRQAVSGIAAGVTVRIGVSADEARHGSVAVSAARAYDMTTASGATWWALGTADANLVSVDATAQASAAELTQFDAIVLVRYIQQTV